MARLGCLCGAEMTNVVSPSKHRLNIYYLAEIQHAIEAYPKIRLWDFYTGWDEKNSCKNSFQDRTETVEYWYCTECGRIYEVQSVSCGKWIRAFVPVTGDESNNLVKDLLKEIVPLTDLKMDEMLEKNSELLLEDYISDFQGTRYFITENEEAVYELTDDKKLQLIYREEEHS